MDANRLKLLCAALGVLLLASVARPARAITPEEQFSVAAGHYAAGRWEDAIAEFEQFLEEHTDHLRAESVAFYLAESLVQLGRYDQAAERFESLLKEHPQGRHARNAQFRVGELLYLSGKRKEAEGQLKAFCERYAFDPLAGFALPYLGELRLTAGDADAAQNYYSEALRRFPEGPMAGQCRYGIGRAYELLDQPDEAIRFYRFLSKDRDHALADDALLQIGIVEHRAGRRDEAVATLQDLLASFPESDHTSAARYWLGASRLADEKYDEAIAALKQVVEESPQHELAPAAAFSLAEALQRRDKPTEAKEWWTRVADDWPESEWADDARQSLVQAAFDARRYDRAAELADQFEQHHPQSDLRPVVRQTLGRALLKQEAFDRAVEVFQPLVEAEDADSANWYYLGLAHLGAERHEEALAALDRIEPGEDQTALRDNLRIARASALLGLQKYEEAAELFRAVLASGPSSGDSLRSRRQLIVCLAELKQFDEAEQVCESLWESGSTADAAPSTLYLAEKAHQAGRRELAERLYERLASADENGAAIAAPALSGLGWSQFEAGDLEGAAATFARLVREYPDADEAPASLLTQAQILEKLDRPDEALDAYRQVLDRFADSDQAPPSMLGAAQLLDARQQDEQAADLLNQLTENHPEFERRDAALYQYAWVLADLQRHDDSDAAFTQLYTDHADSPFWPDAVYRLAERAARGGDDERAIELADELIEADRPGEPLCHALYLKGQLAASAGRWEKVAPAMQRVLAEYPKSDLRLAAEYWSAEALYRLDKFDQAQDAFDSLSHKTASRDDAWLAMIPLRRAQILAQDHQWREAHELAAGVMRRFPEFHAEYEVDYVLGRCLSGMARFREARASLEKVVRSTVGGATETAAMAQWMIGETHFLQKNYREAIRAYYRVERLFDYPRWRAAALLQTGKCYEQLGERREAVRVYAQLVREYGETEFADQAAERLQVAGKEVKRK